MILFFYLFVFCVDSYYVNCVLFVFDMGVIVEIFVFEDDIVWVCVLFDVIVCNLCMWIIVFGFDDVLVDGCDCFDLSDFMLFGYELIEDDDGVCIEIVWIWFVVCW